MLKYYGEKGISPPCLELVEWFSQQMFVNLEIFKALRMRHAPFGENAAREIASSYPTIRSFHGSVTVKHSPVKRECGDI